MKTTKHPFSYNYRKLFPNAEQIGGFEGGAIYKADKSGKWYLIIDEGTMVDFLDDEDKDLLNELIKIIEFDSVTEYNKYIEEHYEFSIRGAGIKSRTKR